MWLSAHRSSASGGERARLALAILALEGANLLLLDEPTNHLDIPAQEVLQEVLENYDGTILLVSHDRYLIDRLATQIWEVRQGALTVFKGRYREWMASKEGRPLADDRRPLTTDGIKPTVDRRPPTVDEKKATAAIRRPPSAPQSAPPRPDKEAKKRAKLLAELEDTITFKENELAALTERLQASGNDHKRARELSEEHAYLQRELEELMAQWEALSAEAVSG